MLQCSFFHTHCACFQVVAWECHCKCGAVSPRQDCFSISECGFFYSCAERRLFRINPQMKRGRGLDELYGSRNGTTKRHKANGPVGGSCRFVKQPGQAKDSRKGVKKQSKPQRSQLQRKRPLAMLLRREQPQGHIEHRKLHPDPKHFASKCPRCKYLVHRQSWRQSIASVQLPGSKQMIWLNEKPARLGLSWGIGCDICASMLARLVVKPSDSCSRSSASSQSEKLKRRLNTKWGRYEICSMSCMQASTIRTEFVTTGTVEIFNRTLKSLCLAHPEETQPLQCAPDSFALFSPSRPSAD